MSKSELKSFLKGLKKNQLEAQIIDLYDRFKEVKVFYDFSFNPDEVKLLEDAKFKIRKEYFPEGYRRPKARRSIAQKLIKHFQTLEVDPAVIAELMYFHVKMGIDFNKARHGIAQVPQRAFAVAFRQLIEFLRTHKLYMDYDERLHEIANRTEQDFWHNSDVFTSAIRNSQSEL